MTKSQVSVFTENQYAEFTTFFRIPFKQGTVEHDKDMWKRLLSA